MMDEKGTIRRGDGFVLAPSVIDALERLAAGFDLRRGRATVEINFQDGRVEFAYLKRRVNLKELQEFEPIFAHAAAANERSSAGS